jgi:hypothetical protein
VGIIGINPDYDYLFDPQQAPTYGYCEKCGADIYARGETLCAECREERMWRM